MTQIPVARGERIPWEGLPERIRAAVEAELGGEVAQAVTAPLGFSPAAAATLITTAGARAFVKAVPPDVNPDSPDIYRREIEISRLLPPGLPAPRLRWWLDEGPEGWVVLLFEHVEGAPPSLPWSDADLRLAVQTMDSLTEALTPAPLALGQAGEWIEAHWRGWRTWAESPPENLDPWLAEWIPRLADLEEAVAERTRGDSLAHLDIRSDNLVLHAGRCWVTDWAWPLQGAPWMDAVLFAASVEAEGGPAAETVMAMSSAGGAAPADGVLALLASFAGMLTVNSTRPAPPGIPGVRQFQAAHARTARAWLRRSLESSA